MTINFCFIIGILFMNSFLILMVFKEALTKKIGVLIIKVTIFTNGWKIHKKQVVQISLLYDVNMDKLISPIF